MQTLNNKSITESQIATLRSEAATAWDPATIVTCDVALGEEIDLDDYAISSRDREQCERAAKMTQDQAVDECVRILNEMRDQS